MTIFFSGNTFKYELEGIAKLFFPLIRFTHIYDTVEDIDDGIITRMHTGRTQTLLWVSVRTHGTRRRLACHTPNAEAVPDECERLLCILLYRVLEDILGVTPQWGILTGIRPVTIVSHLKAEGKSREDIERFLTERYLVHPDKIALSLSVAEVQEPMLSALNGRGRSYSLYVSIPFCPSRCSYCSFVSHSITMRSAIDKIDDYVRLLCVELRETAAIAERDGLLLDTVYIGGGTPTALTADQLKTITDTIAEVFPLDKAREYTIEAGRADSITPEKLEVIKRAGAKRISVNPQTFNDDVLKAIGRHHTAAQAIECYQMARENGFESINMDLIAGLPDDSYDSFCASVNQAIALAPENITVHTLSIKRSSKLFEQGVDIKQNRNADMVEYARSQLIAAGYRPYYLYRQKNTVGNLENVGYAKPSYESLYNIYIMEEIQTILACGAGGVTKLIDCGDQRVSRIFNYKYHFEYIDGFQEILRRKEAIHYD